MVRRTKQSALMELGLPLRPLTPAEETLVAVREAQRREYANAFLAKCREWKDGKVSSSEDDDNMYLWDWTLNPQTGHRDSRRSFNMDVRIGQCQHITSRGLYQQWMASSLMSTTTTGLVEEPQPLVMVEELMPKQEHGRKDPDDEQDRDYQVYTKDKVWFWKNKLSIRKDEARSNVHSAIPTYLCPIPPPRGLNPDILIDDKNNSSATQPIQNHGASLGRCDVWTRHCPELIPIIRPLLDDQAMRTMDTPIPRYHNIIDPNLFVRKMSYIDGNYYSNSETIYIDGNYYSNSETKMVWVPSEFDVSANGDTVRLVGDRRSHWMTDAATTQGDDLIRATATPVLQRALPMLARLRKPCMLLQGQRLQVVVKAQRIVLPPAKEEDDPTEYVGLWHVDGEHEAVAAVVLYYYHVHDALRGGNMEFIDRSPMDVFSDSSPFIREQSRHRLFRNDPDFVQNNVRPSYATSLQENKSLNHCSAPIHAGQMLVFSNYQMAHRVLRMINTSTSQSASRDFVALFILDPATRPLVPARCHLSVPYNYERALGGYVVESGTTSSKARKRSHGSDRTEVDNDVVTNSEVFLHKKCVQNILEFLGLLPTMAQRRKTRLAMLRSQLEPKGGLCGSLRSVYSTGNGCFTMVGWIKDMLKEKEKSDYRDDHIREAFGDVHKRVASLNRVPKTIGRGLSETLSIPTDDLDGEE